MQKRKILGFLLCLAIMIASASMCYAASEPTDTSLFEFDASTGTILKYNMDASLSDIVIPEKINGVAVVAIGDGAFYRDVAPEMQELWSRFSEQEKVVFYSKLRSVTIPEGVKTIGNNAFAYNYALTEINLPSTLKYIGEAAFEDCMNLPTIDLPDSITEIGARAFSGCKSITAVQLPVELSEIKNATFFGCSALEKVTLGVNVKKIGSEAFEDCVNLKEVYIPNNIKGIGQKAFEGCTSLSKISVDQDAFLNPLAIFAKRYLPAESSGEVVCEMYWNNTPIWKYVAIAIAGIAVIAIIVSLNKKLQNKRRKESVAFRTIKAELRNAKNGVAPLIDSAMLNAVKKNERASAEAMILHEFKDGGCSSLAILVSELTTINGMKELQAEFERSGETDAYIAFALYLRTDNSDLLDTIENAYIGQTEERTDILNYIGPYSQEDKRLRYFAEAMLLKADNSEDELDALIRTILYSKGYLKSILETPTTKPVIALYVQLHDSKTRLRCIQQLEQSGK